MSVAKVSQDVIENAQLCAERGWKANFHLVNGESIERAYITGTNWEKGIISVERIGERHLPPRLLDLKDVKSVEVGWA